MVVPVGSSVSVGVTVGQQVVVPASDSVVVVVVVGDSVVELVVELVVVGQQVVVPASDSVVEVVVPQACGAAVAVNESARRAKTIEQRMIVVMFGNRAGWWRGYCS